VFLEIMKVGKTFVMYHSTGSEDAAEIAVCLDLKPSKFDD